jgi:hypothetical protein
VEAFIPINNKLRLTITESWVDQAGAPRDLTTVSSISLTLTKPDGTDSTGNTAAVNSPATGGTASATVTITDTAVYTHASQAAKSGTTWFYQFVVLLSNGSYLNSDRVPFTVKPGSADLQN